MAISCRYIFLENCIGMRGIGPVDWKIGQNQFPPDRPKLMWRHRRLNRRDGTEDPSLSNDTSCSKLASLLNPLKGITISGSDSGLYGRGRPTVSDTLERWTRDLWPRDIWYLTQYFVVFQNRVNWGIQWESFKGSKLPLADQSESFTLC